MLYINDSLTIVDITLHCWLSMTVMCVISLRQAFIQCFVYHHWYTDQNPLRTESPSLNVAQVDRIPFMILQGWTESHSWFCKGGQNPIHDFARVRVRGRDFFVQVFFCPPFQDYEGDSIHPCKTVKGIMSSCAN